MTCETPCKNCDRKGLPILFTRYAAAYSAQDKGMAALKPLQPAGQFQKQPGGVALTTALYNVRMLRAGYLYVHVDRGNVSGEDEWKGYAVHPHGYLAEFDVMQPGNAKVHLACARDARQANNSMVWVKDAKRVRKLWYMFHPDPVDPAHLLKEILPNLGKYMQSFDVAGWAAGNTSQKGTCQAGQLSSQVVEFSARSNEALRSACEPLLYGLMGCNAQERGWGDYSQERRAFAETAGGAAVGARPVNRTVDVTGPAYDAAHGVRLNQMAEFLLNEKGAVVACDDAIGIAQELGHLQAEAQSLYTAWQKAQAGGCSKGVSNEWAFQTAIGANGLMTVAEQGAVARVEKGFEESSQIKAPLPSDHQAAATEQARRAAAREANRKRALKETTASIKAAYEQLFDRTVADKIIAAQDNTYKDTETVKAKLGGDQVEWLTATEMQKIIGRFSDKDERVGASGGGAALSAQLAQCMAGTESNTNGQAWIRSQDVTGNGLLARVLCFNSITLKKTWQEVEATKLASTEPASKAEPSTAGAESAAERVKITGASTGMGDKALALQDALREAKVGLGTAAIFTRMAGRVGIADQAHAFLDKLQALDASGAFRKATWPLHIASLMSVKMIQTLNNLPLTQMETTIVRYTALTGLISMGKTAERHAVAMKLPQSEHDAMLQARRKIAAAAHATPVGIRAPNARAAALAAVFDVGQAALKGKQLAVKGDARTASEMVGNLLQGIGSIADWRAKAYEETVYKGVTMLDLVNKASTQEIYAAKTLQDLQLKGVRLTACKFLLPAAMVSVFWDATDALTSRDRGRMWLARAQMAGAIGTVFAIASTLMVATGAVLGISATTWAAVAATFGLVGAALVVISAIAVYLLKEDEWQTWLRDNPLNKERKGEKPIHESLRDTLQKLANAQAAAA